MPRRLRAQTSTPSPGDAESLFADLLDDEISTSDDELDEAGEVDSAGNRGIPPECRNYGPAPRAFHSVDTTLRQALT
jgi:hypothetical protein